MPPTRVICNEERLFHMIFHAWWWDRWGYILYVVGVQSKDTMKYLYIVYGCDLTCHTFTPVWLNQYAHLLHWYYARTPSAIAFFSHLLFDCLVAAKSCMAITVPNSSNGNLSSGVFGTTAPVDVTCSSGYTGGGIVTCESTGNYTSVSCTGLSNHLPICDGQELMLNP